MSRAEQRAASPSNILNKIGSAKSETEYNPAGRGLKLQPTSSGTAKSRIALSTAKCPVCQIIANAMIQWPEGQDSLRLGQLAGFLGQTTMPLLPKNRQADEERATVRHHVRTNMSFSIFSND